MRVYEHWLCLQVTKQRMHSGEMNGAGAEVKTHSTKDTQAHPDRTGQVPSSDPRTEPPVGTGLWTALRIWEDGSVGEEVAT